FAGAYITPVLADFNNDGNLDVALGGGSGLGAVLLGDGHGNFGPPLVFGQGSVVGIVGAIAAADLNRDGILDIVTVNETSNNISVLLGKGD
ncbi:FG-GAP-like repeat-containing protein, partial [Enterococcus faecium]|uniref:FG-GAP-like repeat-containing protein n=1 Tax=Enterococcus faecium TaxID=1352 RepID=UPI003F41F6C8